MSIELVVPEVGESVTEVQIGRWLKNPGDPVRKDEPLVEIETDKVTLELPAPADGTVAEVLKQQGADAVVGDVIGKFNAGAVSEQPAAVGAGESKQEQQQSSSNGSNGNGDRVMPAAQRLLDEHNLDAGAITASGPGGRLLKEDVIAHVEAQAKAHAAPAALEAAHEPVKAVSKPKPKKKPAEPEAPLRDDEERVPMTPMRRRIAERLVAAQHTGALLTTFNEIDMTEVMALRGQYKEPFEKKYDIKLGFMSFFVKATVDALKQFPEINAEVRGTDIIYKNHYDVGIAIGAGKGLVVPILRDADRLSFAQIEQAIAEFAGRAKDNKLKLEELQGGTFTITNGGVYGSLLSTPIINPPQSGVLGMHGIQQRAVVIDGEVVPRPMMYVALTYDHRIVDGREAVTFLRRIKEAIEDPSRMLMEV